MNQNKALATTEKLLQDYFKKPVVDITKDELESYLEMIKEDYTYSTFRTKVVLINGLMKSIGSTVKVNVRSGDATFTEKGIVTKKDIESAMNMLDNAQDKFILLAVYNGILGKQASELLNLKRSDIDLNNSAINTGVKTVMMDGEFKTITKDAMEQVYYSVLSIEGNYSGVANEIYELADDSEYVVKVRPTKRNNLGRNAMSYNGFRTRFADICAYTGLDVTLVSLEKSGYLNRLKNDGISMEINSVSNWIKNNGLKVDKYLLLRLYKEYDKCYNK